MLGIGPRDPTIDASIKTEVKVEDLEPVEQATCQYQPQPSESSENNNSFTDQKLEKPSEIRLEVEQNATPPSENNNLTERQQAMMELKRETETSRLNRLNYLLEKSTLYSQFLSQRLEKEQQEKREKIREEQGNKKVGGLKRKNGERVEISESIEETSPPKRHKDEGPVIPDETPSTRIINGQIVSPRQPSLVTGGILKEYQLTGFEWLVSLY
ncbi:putative ATPase [Basidiobolus ranarum]|uniref:ATPase n=1 Tax=Basidiobolus ranarum TaxID=34480 RepID=A0ABR2WS67_9FUNG